MTQEATTLLSSGVLILAIQLLIPLMIAGLVLGVLFRYLIYKTVRRHEWFAQEFEKRVNNFIEDEDPSERKSVSFYSLSKRLLEKTFYEVFELRDRLHRRKKDRVESLADRVFLVRAGSAWFVRDLLKQIKFVKWNSDQPKLLNITKTTFQQNPYYNRVLGIFSIGLVNDILAVLPGLFVIGGIFGTFMGIVNGLPKLGGMNLSNVEMSKQIMDGFLFEVAFAMNSSILGIFCSVVMTIMNTVYSAERYFTQTIDRVEAALDLLWYRSDHNDFRKSDSEESDPSVTLAEQTLQIELSRGVRTRSLDEVRKNKAS